MQPLISPIDRLKLVGMGLTTKLINSALTSSLRIKLRPKAEHLKKDHESRHNSYRAEDNHLEEEPEEGTPLLRRFPQNEGNEPSVRVTTVVVSLLLLILISGVIIGIYLLIVQNNSENVLPLVDTPLQVVSQTQWNSNNSPDLSLSPFKAKQVIVVQTGTEQCYDLHSCAELLHHMQMNCTEHTLPYNFLLSSNGQTFEALGWRRPSPLFPEYPTALVLGFIGNFNESLPTRLQIDEAKNFFAESVSLQHLEPSFIIIGRKTSTKDIPKYLIQSLKKLPQWDSQLSDNMA